MSNEDLTQPTNPLERVQAREIARAITEDLGNYEFTNMPKRTEENPEPDWAGIAMSEPIPLAGVGDVVSVVSSGDGTPRTGDAFVVIDMHDPKQIYSQTEGTFSSLHVFNAKEFDPKTGRGHWQLKNGKDVAARGDGKFSYDDDPKARDPLTRFIFRYQNGVLGGKAVVPGGGVAWNKRAK